MEIEQIYTGCLAQGAYYITSNGEAAIIDPLRETAPYIERIKKDNVVLKYIFETHFHADFVSGHLDLSKKTGAPIVFGPSAESEFDMIVAKDNQEFTIGDVTIKALHTPGHTLESTTYLLKNENRKDYAIFSGDTLFLGDVGRPDLAQKSSNMTQDELAGLLYDSLQNKILPLANDVIVYPAHGAGSACGKNMSKETIDNLGNQKKTNYALNQADKSSFIKAVTNGLLSPPAYFGQNVEMNKKGYESFDTVLVNGMKAMEPEEFELIVERTNALILDTRSESEFYKGFIPQSVNIALNGDFAPWIGTLIMDVNQPLLLVTDKGTEEEVITRLSRVGFDKVLGFLNGGFNTWLASGKEADTVDRISAFQFAKEFEFEIDIVIDVRKENEFILGHLKNALNKPLANINDWINDLDEKEHFYIYCSGGYRSMAAASILEARGYRNFTEIEGGIKAIKQTNISFIN
jgi:glyoxylase-like metal-dependent hydrolase (beta-lactamase superfamily II)/rhodanese-related sulfurtransferase